MVSIQLCKKLNAIKITIDLFDVIRHIIVFTSKFKDDSGKWRTCNQVHIQVMTGSENQESSVNVALMRKALEIFHAANSSITSVWVRSDNAG